MNSTFLMPLSRKQILKRFGKNSPFAAPVNRKETPDSELKSINFVSKLSADYGGVIAFEIEFEDIVGLDYCNTLVYSGSRIVIEAKKGKKRWFCSAKEFCIFYGIFNTTYKTPYYAPVLNATNSYFLTRQMYPIDQSKEELSLEIPKLPGGVTNYHGRNNSADIDTETSDHDNHTRKHRAKSEQSDSECEYEIHKDEGKEFKNRTIVAYFEDPVFPFFMKDLIKQSENSNLLKMYERGIPSWAVFLPSYGLPYRP